MAAFNCVAVWIGVTFSSYHGHAWLIIGWGAYVGFLIVMLIASVSCSASPIAPTATRRATPSPASCADAARTERLARRGPFVLVATAARSAPSGSYRRRHAFPPDPTPQPGLRR